jgi:hypothetical protein
MDMHMFGLMYAPSDRITLMGMTSYQKKSMDHTVYMGGMGVNTLGGFTTRTSGMGDSRISALVRLFNRGKSRAHWTLGLGIPTGSTDETGQILTPANMQPVVRLPYPMQLGTGTWDLLTGLTWAGFGDRSGWGAQWTSRFPLAKNDEGYEWGNEHRLTAWASHQLSPGTSLSIRVTWHDQGAISGLDSAIMLPVQTADPARMGGSGFDLGLGINLAGQGGLKGHRVALEINKPIEQDLNGPQLETDWTAVLGWQYSF